MKPSSGSPADPEPRPLIVAHRGYHRIAHENSGAALDHAVHVGADMVEFDVRRTADGVLVLHHGPDLHGAPLAQLTAAQIDEIQRSRGLPPIITLSDAAGRCRGRIGMDIEIKEAGYEDEVLSAVLGLVSADDIVVTSFLDSAVRAVKESHPEVRVGLLISVPVPNTRPTLTDLFPIGRTLRCGADFLAPHDRLATQRVLERARARHLPLLVWGVNRPSRLHAFLKRSGILGVVTDAPDIALAIRQVLEIQGGQGLGTAET